MIRYPALLSSWQRMIASLIILLGFVSGCSLKKAVVLDQHEAEIHWRQHQQQLMAFPSWKLTGRLGIVSDEQSGSATLYWEQHPQSFSMRVVAPLGRGVVSLKGQGDQVQMQDAGGEVFTASSAEQLIWRRTGWLIPVAGLQKWALGLPDEQVAFDYSLDNQGRLKTLLTSGWRIQYQSYTQYRDLFLPKKIYMQNNELTLKLVVTRWELL